MNNALTYILGIVIVVLTAFSGYFYINNSKLETTIDKHTTEINRLEESLEHVTKAYKESQILNKELSDIVLIARNKESQLKELRDDVLKNIDERGNVHVEATLNTKGGSDPIIDDSISSMLSNLCERIRGSACPNP